MQYLKGLNGLRFLAAFLVLICHAQSNLSALNIAQGNWLILYLGTDAVEFFFVLSGFLLTYIAIEEFDTTGAINIRYFFIKRILRIWPLYYLCVGIGFVLLGWVLPYVQGVPYFIFPVKQGLPYYLFMLPNYAAALYGDGCGTLYALWTIGTEEHFYIFFPFLMLLVLKSKRRLAIIITITIVYATLYYLQYYGFFKTTGTTWPFINLLSFQFMLAGSAAAIACKKMPNIVNAILPGKRLTQLVLFALLAAALSFNPVFGYGAYAMVPGVLFAAIIINTFSSPVHIINFEKPWLSYLGVISYGIYMYHPYISLPLRYAIIKIGWVRSLFMMVPVLYYLVLLVTTIGVAHVSYKYFERQFLKMKNKFTITANSAVP